SGRGSGLLSSDDKEYFGQRLFSSGIPNIVLGKTAIDARGRVHPKIYPGNHLITPGRYYFQH
ncbi:MAG TPA: hypothetical protein VLH15_09600, partial [Dehalococcoidales bacterium]|nr:hypothetical protein [Dehalococcoidales bacterium]